MAGGDDFDVMQYFKKGAKVEASSDDSGFRDSWYEATVIKPAESEFSKARIQFKNLTDNKGKKPLREWVRLVLLRPLPPRENNPVFEFNEAVDAYHDEGWWEGFITGIYEGNRYKVFFRGTREELDFPASELRLHREWVKGKWIPPLDSESKSTPSPSVTVPEANLEGGEIPEAVEEVPEHVFKLGDLVEASSDDDGLEGAWFSGTIVEELADGKYIIEYKTLKNEDDTGLLREVVNRPHLRPCPPYVGLVDSFGVDSEVDAFYNDGWWVGVILRVLKNDRYLVYFESTDEQMKFEHSDLRVHQEWKNGKWYIASKVLTFR